jgi:transposase InsO family protein
VLQVAPSGYWRYAAERHNPDLRCARTQRDEILVKYIPYIVIETLPSESPKREGVAVARRTVERLMRSQGLHGVMRGKGVRKTDE